MVNHLLSKAVVLAVVRKVLLLHAIGVSHLGYSHDIDPDGQVKEAMNRINASRFLIQN